MGLGLAARGRLTCPGRVVSGLLIPHKTGIFEDAGCSQDAPVLRAGCAARTWDPRTRTALNRDALGATVPS